MGEPRFFTSADLNMKKHTGSPFSGRRVSGGESNTRLTPFMRRLEATLGKGVEYTLPHSGKEG